jgi:hypothetical protein
MKDSNEVNLKRVANFLRWLRDTPHYESYVWGDRIVFKATCRKTGRKIMRRVMKSIWQAAYPYLDIPRDTLFHQCKIDRMYIPNHKGQALLREFGMGVKPRRQVTMGFPTTHQLNKTQE